MIKTITIAILITILFGIVSYLKTVSPPGQNIETWEYILPIPTKMSVNGEWVEIVVVELLPIPE